MLKTGLGALPAAHELFNPPPSLHTHTHSHIQPFPMSTIIPMFQMSLANLLPCGEPRILIQV